MRPISIGIAGAGTAGLAAAAALTRDGHNVRLFERFDRPKPIGAGLLLQPTGLACLARLALDRTAITQGQVVSSILGETVTGRRIFDVSYHELGEHVFGIGMHRGTLFSLLYDEALRLGIPVTASSKIKGSRCVTEGRVLIDQNANEHGPFDLVVDGTGIRSPLRAACASIRFDRPYAYGALWGIIEEAPGWPHRHRLMQRYDGCHTMIGILPVGCAPGGTKRLSALFWSLRVADYPAWRSGGIGQWRQHALRMFPEAEPLICQIRSVEDMTFATYSDTVLRRCWDKTIVFVGDAGRAVSPQLGQGANLALIDTVTLSDCLRQASSIEDALATYGRQRRAHTAFYSLASRWLTPFFQSDSRAAARLRDLAFPLMGRVPYLRREMVRTLSGMKTGLFSHLDPGIWHSDYALAGPSFSSQPA